MRVSELTATGSFHHSIAALASAELVIVFHPVARLSTCRSYCITQLHPAATSTEENVRIGATKLSLGLPQLLYVKLYGVPKSVFIVSVMDIPVASVPEFESVIVYRTI